jgi:hypothetical protein
MPLQDCQHTVIIAYSFTNYLSRHTLWLVKISDFFEAHFWFKMFTLTHNSAPQEALTFRAQTPGRSCAIARTAETCWCIPVWSYTAPHGCLAVRQECDQDSVTYVPSRHPTRYMNFLDVSTAISAAKYYGILSYMRQRSLPPWCPLQTCQQK